MAAGANKRFIDAARRFADTLTMRLNGLRPRLNNLKTKPEFTGRSYNGSTRFAALISGHSMLTQAFERTCLLEVLLEQVGSVLDNLDRADRMGWISSASDWAELRRSRKRIGTGRRAIGGSFGHC